MGRGREWERIVKNVCVQKKKKSHLIFKTQDDKMIYFPMCEKLAMNKLLPLRVACWTSRYPVPWMGTAGGRRQKAFREKNVTRAWNKGSINSLFPTDVILTQPQGSQSILVGCSPLGFSYP